MATGTLTYGTVVGTQVDFGASDAPLSASQLTNPATGSYTNSGVDGPLIQIPTFGVPIALAYNETAETSTLSLTDAQLCGVLSGKITDWHTLNSKIAAGTTIQVVYFSNSSGATYLTSQHLNAVCTSSNSNFPEYPVPITKYFYSTTAANNPIFLSSPPPNFTGEAAAANAAAEMVATPNSFGYISPDWTSIAPKSANTTALKVASVVNGINNKGYTPTVANTETGLANAGPGSQYPTPPNTLTNAMDPINWVPTIPQTSKGYSIVGYSTVELSSCYASTTAGTALNTFLTDLYQTSSYKTIITNNGFVPLSNTAASPYITSVLNDFLSNKSGYNLNIDSKSLCASYPGR
jgi:ABC-type phosphate transport system substrate-binding protein